MARRKGLCLLIGLIIAAKLIFNVSIFVVEIKEANFMHQPYCQSCSRVCGFWKCLTISLIDGNEFTDYDIWEIIKFGVNFGLILLEVPIVIILCVKYLEDGLTDDYG